MSPLKVLFAVVALAPLAHAEPPATIKNEAASLTVSLTPEPRIVSFQRTGGVSPLLDDPGYERTGIRFFALEEKDGKQTGTVFGGEAKWIERKEDRCVFESTLGEKGNVTLRVALKLLPGTSRVVADCELRNNAEERRTLALWAIASVPAKGWIVTTISRGIENGAWTVGQLRKFYMSDSNDPVLKTGRDALAFDLSQWNREGSPKFGTRSNEGWIAVARPDLKTLLLVLLPYDSGDRYPDGDSNVTLWYGTTPSKVPYGEAEWLSPWREVEAGKTLGWRFSLELRQLAEMEKVTPDALVNAVRYPLKFVPATPAAEGDWRLSFEGPLMKDSFGRVTEFYGNDGQVLAKAPIWYDAPVWTEQGIQWLPDTLVEAVAETIPEWTGGDRSWTVGIHGPGADAELLQEGDEKAGVAILTAGGKARVVLWSGSESVEVSDSLSAEPGQTIRAKVEGRTLQVRVNDQPGQKVDIPFALPSPARRVALGRFNARPGEILPRGTPRFLGCLREVTITP